MAEIWRELAVGNACFPAETEGWPVIEEELLDELTELELFLLAQDPNSAARPEPPANGKPADRRS